MGVDYNFPENHEEWLPYITLVFIDLHGMSGLRWLLHTGIIRDSFGSIVFLLVGNLKKTHTHKLLLVSFRGVLNSYLLCCSVPLGFYIFEYHH